MSGVMYLGNQMVSPVIVKGNAEYVGRELTPEGKYQIISDTTYTLPEAVKDVGDRGCAFLFYGNGSLRTFNSGDLENISGSNAFGNFLGYSSIKNVNFNSVKSITGNGACRQLVCESPTVENVSFNSLESINGDTCFVAFAQIDDIDGSTAPVFSFNFDNLKTINGNNIFEQGIIYRKVKNIRFLNLETITGNAVFYQFYREVEDTLESIELPKLKKVSGEVFNKMLYGSNFSKLTTVDFSSLEELEDYGFYNFFGKRPTNVTAITLPKLNKVGEKVLASFAPSSLKILIFNSLNQNSFGEYTNQFNNMLSGCSNCTVYFPPEVESIIRNWSDVLSGFGGTNTSIVFSLPLLLTLNINPDTTSILHNGTKVGNLYIIEEQYSYFIFSGNNGNVLYVYEAQGDEKEATLNIDMNTYVYNKITVNDGIVGGLSKLVWRDLEIPMVEESEGVYSCYLNSPIGETLTYINEGGSTEYKAETEIQTTGEDINITVTPEQIQTRSFVRPKLSSNGVMGGNSFAVMATANEASAFETMDNNPSDFWYASVDSSYTFYNPRRLNVSSLVFTWYGSSYKPSSITLKGSNDLENWDDLGTSQTTSTSTYTLTPTSFGYYKYYRLDFTKEAALYAIINIDINALEEIP